MSNVSLERAGRELQTTLLESLPEIVSDIRDLQTESLIEYTKMTRVEPIVLFDETLRLQPFAQDIMSALVNIFTGYYLQAVAITTNVGNVEVRKLLSKLDPDRVRNLGQTVVDMLSIRYYEGIDSLLGLEDYPYEEEEEARRKEEHEARQRDRMLREEKDRVESKRKEREDRSRLREERRRIREEQRRKKEDERREGEDKRREGEDKRREEAHKEKMDEAFYKHRREEKEEHRRSERHKMEMDKAKEVPEAQMGISRQSIDDFNTSANLSTGKLITVEIENDGKKANIPVNIRLITKLMPPDALVGFLTVIKSDRTLSTRWKRWKQGEISFFRDLVLCQDIIDEERKAHHSDKEGLFRNLRSRNRSKENTTLDAVIGDINVATASSIVVMSKETALKVERALMGRLDHFATREGLLKVTFTMILIVVDVKREKVIMYHKSINEATILSIRDFKGKSDKAGPDINEILMAYRAGTAPTF